MPNESAKNIGYILQIKKTLKEGFCVEKIKCQINSSCHSVKTKKGYNKTPSGPLPFGVVGVLPFEYPIVAPLSDSRLERL